MAFASITWMPLNYDPNNIIASFYWFHTERQTLCQASYISYYSHCNFKRSWSSLMCRHGDRDREVFNEHAANLVCKPGSAWLWIIFPEWSCWAFHKWPPSPSSAHGQTSLHCHQGASTSYFLPDLHLLSAVGNLGAKAAPVFIWAFEMPLPSN